MNRQHSLSHVLARQWVVFTLGLSALFIAATLLLLFVLEDSFIDRRLRTVAASVADPAIAPPGLPSQFSVLAMRQLPDDIRTRVAGKATGHLAEFRRDDGRYVHVLLARADAGAPFAVIYDVTDELTVNAGLSRGLAFALPLLLLLLVCAYALARAFVGRVARRARGLVEAVLASPDPQHLHALAQREPVREFGDLVRLHAHAWQDQLAAVERERQTLAFLGHELRTPLQSARTSLALLERRRTDPAAWARLQRAVERLVRASTAILWLSSDAVPTAEGHTQAADCLRELVEELAPLAAVKNQRIELLVEPDLRWPWPSEVVETVLANLLLNAIQHGDAGAIGVCCTRDSLTIRNPRAPLDTGGFGLGLQIVQRLAARIGWAVSFEHDELTTTCTLAWPA
ncbi:sensor histidine kinase [Lysobacter sp. D1-1-M9]|uniref:sensor histidine kinase n=2 Tax=Novilysobacter TaxID=3382699 RepID=UPI002FCBE838